jgi:hypothetical protein
MMLLFEKKEKLSDPIALPPFGSTEVCRACGDQRFFRRYCESSFSIGLSEHIIAYCNSCLAPHKEGLKGN